MILGANLRAGGLKHECCMSVISRTLGHGVWARAVCVSADDPPRCPQLPSMTDAMHKGPEAALRLTLRLLEGCVNAQTAYLWRLWVWRWTRWIAERVGRFVTGVPQVVGWQTRGRWTAARDPLRTDSTVPGTFPMAPVSTRETRKARTPGHAVLP